MVKVKICGLMREEDVLLCGKLGVDIAGFVAEYPLPVPWNLTRSRVRALMELAEGPMKTCLVTGGEREAVLELVKSLAPDYVQLHYRETLEDTRRITAALAPLGTGVIKTLPLDGEERLRQFGKRDLETCVGLLEEAGVSALLVDSRGPKNAASGGERVDSGLFERVKASARIPVILAGGITPENAREVTAALGPEMVDVMTGVESSPGVKRETALRALLKELGR